MSLKKLESQGKAVEVTVKSKEETLKNFVSILPKNLASRWEGEMGGGLVENDLGCRSVKQIFRIDNLLILLLEARSCLCINDLHALKPCMLGSKPQGQATSFDY